MVNLWFTDRDLRYRLCEVKRLFWTELEDETLQAAKRLLEESLRQELARSVGAAHYQRTSERRDYRNGSYCRDMVWKMGVLSGVCIPRSRLGAYRSKIIERYRRFGGTFDQQVLKLFTLGLSTRRVEDFFRSFFGDCGVSSQTVSEILKRVSAELAEYHQRPLSDTVRYLYLDAIWVTIRGAFRNKYPVLVALAEYTDGRREIVDFQPATSEKAIHWQALLDRLYRRGLQGKRLKLVVTDGARGLQEAVRTVYGFVALQVCWVHKLRNLVSRLKHRDNRKAICADVKRIFQADSKTEAIQRIREFQRRWQDEEPRAVRLFLQDIDLSLSFYDQPREQCSALASNNVIESRCENSEDESDSSIHSETNAHVKESCTPK